MLTQRGGKPFSGTGSLGVLKGFQVRTNSLITHWSVDCMFPCLFNGQLGSFHSGRGINGAGGNRSLVFVSARFRTGDLSRVRRT